MMERLDVPADRHRGGAQARKGTAAATPPEFQKPPVEVPPPDVTIDLPWKPRDHRDHGVAATRTLQRRLCTLLAQARRAGEELPDSEDFYLRGSKRLNEEGAPTVHVCVGASGKLSAAPTIAQSSGSPRLDEGALNLAKAGR